MTFKPLLLVGLLIVHPVRTNEPPARPVDSVAVSVMAQNDRLYEENLKLDKACHRLAAQLDETEDKLQDVKERFWVLRRALWRAEQHIEVLEDRLKKAKTPPRGEEDIPLGS